jgi:hypothetical protein
MNKFATIYNLAAALFVLCPLLPSLPTSLPPCLPPYHALVDHPLYHPLDYPLYCPLYYNTRQSANGKGLSANNCSCSLNPSHGWFESIKLQLLRVLVTRCVMLLRHRPSCCGTCYILPPPLPK